MAAALEQHQFKEEMRLFPMMEQGGNTLIGHLIDDLEAEHRMHEDTMAALQAALAGWHDGGADAQVLRAGLARLFADLADHVRVEDEVLFPRFSEGGRRRA
jgi:regulator of cell morphogenesis and NO signaling